MSEGQVTLFSVLTSLRFLVDGSPQESSGRELELSKPPGCARGQCSIDPGRWDVAVGQGSIKSISPGKDWGQRLCLCMCVGGPESISRPTHCLIMNHSKIGH